MECTVGNLHCSHYGLWRADTTEHSDHIDSVPFSASLYPLGIEGFTGVNQSTAWGWFHVNAVEQYDNGYIISSRFLCSAIAIDGTDGHVKWRLSGRTGADFKLIGSNTTTGFCYQ